MLKRIKYNFGQSTMEYIALFMFVCGALMISQKYILHAFNGRWKGVGDQWGHGMLYDPDGAITKDCKYDPHYTQRWYDYRCYYRNNCNHWCYAVQDARGQCTDCIAGCYAEYCEPGFTGPMPE